VAGVALVLLVISAALLAACQDERVEVDGFHVTSADRAPCRELVEALPEKLADAPRRKTSGSEYAAAWGDPAIVLRCGVPLPGSYATDPCITRDGIGWSIPLQQTEDQDTDIVMTLAHRDLIVQVRVPRHYRPNGAMEVMADLGGVVEEHTTARGRCS